MSLWLAALLASLAFAILAPLLMFVIAFVAAPRNITSGPTVILARGLFLVACGCGLIALVCLVGGMATSWA